jgi:transcriptional regulator with XRE-family HTH domain
VSDRPEKDELAATLKQLRHAAKLSSPVAGKQLRRTQSWVSHRENGVVVPTHDDLDELLMLYGAPAATRRHLHALVRDLRDDPNPPARLTLRRAGDMQARYGRIEAASRRIGGFAPILVPGLLQTEAYMRVVFGSGDDMPAGQRSAAITERLARARLLEEPGREFVFVIAEGALRWCLGDPWLMAEQLKRLIEVADWPTVRLGVIPWITAVRVAPTHAFQVYDRRAATVGTLTATAFLTNPHDVGPYLALFADLEAAATFGEDARAMIAEIAGDYRTL